MTATYIYMGYGVTDENGKAKLEYDSSGNPLTHSYTGTGAGEIDIVASLDHPLDEDSLISDPYPIIDAEWIYNGTDNTQASSWYNYQSYITITYNENGTKATTDGGTTRYLYYNDSTVSSTKVGGYYSIPNNHTIEFDVTSITGSVQIVFIGNNSTPTQRFIDLTTIGHYKCVTDGTHLTIYKNGEQQGNSYSLSDNNFQFRFGFNASEESITFKNFIIYP